MTAAAKNRATKHYGPSQGFIHRCEVQADAVIFAGTMIAKDTDGFWKPVVEETTLGATLVAMQSADATGLDDAELVIEGASGTFGFDIAGGADELDNQDMGASVYDSTVGKTSDTNTRTIVGKLIMVEGAQAFVQFGIGSI
jgi:hypothetical protein